MSARYAINGLYDILDENFGGSLQPFYGRKECVWETILEGLILKSILHYNVIDELASEDANFNKL